LTALSEIMKSLGDETRYKIVRLLLQHDLCVGALAQRLGISESAVSQHLKVLRSTGIVKGEKRGYFTHYSVDRDLIQATAREIDSLARLEKIETKCSMTCSKGPSCRHNRVKKNQQKT
jgi:ArsR family transcriptional regulator, arsenate/arsenite/antimonite-responsive transcriptional repressor